MRPDMRSGPPPDTGSRPQKSVSTRTAGTASVADTTDKLRALVAQAAALVAEICDQTERDRQSWDAGYREAAALFFAHGVSVGYAQAEEDMARAWRPVAERVRNIPKYMEIRERRSETTCSAYCTHDGCKTLVTVPPRIDFRRVLCPIHRPETWCARHRARDTCGYQAELQGTQRPEYTGGPVEWDGTSPRGGRPAGADERSRAELLRLRGRDRYPLPDRECSHCHGTGMFSGGAA